VTTTEGAPLAMEPSTARGVRLHPIEIDLLCTFAEVEAPFPLEIESSGQTYAEQLMIYRGAREALTERGLADEGGPLGVAEDFVHLIRFGTGALDLVLFDDLPRLRAVVLADRGEALLVTQDPRDEVGYVYLKPITLDEAVEELMAFVPKHDAPMAAPFTLPRRAIAAVYSELAEHMGDPETGVPPEELSGNEVDELIHSRGIDERAVRNMVTHLQPVFGNGQAGIARRTGAEGDEWRRDGDELRWLDTSRGRWRFADGDETGLGRSTVRATHRSSEEEDDESEGSEWISVNPFPMDEMRSALRKLAARLR
jgi:ESAT-6 protein secretion system EspG family protein